MSKALYSNSAISNTNSFQDWIDITNTIINDMATSVVTAANSASGGMTSGNVAISGVMSANSLVANSSIRGGNSTSSASLVVSSNLETTHAVLFSGDVTFSGATKSFVISTLSVNVNSTQTNFNSNVALKSSTTANTVTATRIDFSNANSVFVAPSGNTAARPSVEGAIRYNTETDKFEGRDATAWSNFLDESDASSFQANSATLTAISAVTPSSNNFLMAANSTTFVNVPSKNYGVGFLNTENANSALTKLNLSQALSTITGIANTAEANAATSDTVVMTPAKTKTLLNNFVLGMEQTWYDLSAYRSHSTIYRNTTGRPIEVAISGVASNSRGIQVSFDGVNGWMTIGIIPNDQAYPNGTTFTVPNNWHYRVNGSTGALNWCEMR